MDENNENNENLEAFDIDNQNVEELRNYSEEEE